MVLRDFLGPQRVEYFEELVGHGTAVGIWDAQDVELLLQPTHSDAADDPAAGQDVQGSEHLGLNHRVAVGKDQHRAAQPYFAGAGGHEPQHGHCFQEWFVGRPLKGAGRRIRVLVGAAHGKHDVVARHHGLKAQALGALAELADSFGIGQSGNADTYFHGKISWPTGRD